MPKTAAQRAARNRRRKAKAQRMKGGGNQPYNSRPKKGPLFKNPVRVKAKMRNTGYKPNGMNYVASDGLNSSLVTTNTSMLEDRFTIRKEKIADINGATAAFTIQEQLYVNPGNSAMFPIFSQTAGNYEQYRVNHLKFSLETEAYTASGSTQTAGIAVLATNFDPDDSNFASLTQMENYYGRVKGPPYATIMTHDVLAAHKGRNGRGGKREDLALNNYYVYSSNNGAAPSNSTSKFYDIGNFQLAVANMANTGIIGELYVEYSFTMIRPKQNPAPGGATAHFSSITATTANNFAGAVLQGGNTLSGVTLGTNTVIFPAGLPGNYFLAMSIAGSTSASALSLVSGPAGSGTINLFTTSGVRDTAATAESLAGTTTNSAMLSCSINFPAAGGILTYGPSTVVGTGSMDLFIFALPPTVLTVDEKEELEIEALQRSVEVLVQERNTLESRLLRLEGLLSPPCLDSSDDCKESMDRSVHISRGAVAKLFGMK